MVTVDSEDSDRFADMVMDVVDGREPVEDLEQQNFTLPAVVVRVIDPVQVQQLPSIGGPSRNLNMTTEVVKVLNSDPRRSRAVIICDAAFYVGTEKIAVSGGTAAKWPANVPLEIKSRDILYAAAVTGVAVISVINDQWAD